MSAALLQGVPATTLDTDIWIDLPERQYFRILALCQKLNATPLAKTVVELRDESQINFLYRIDGLRSFDREYQTAKIVSWQGLRIPVLPLDRILKSKMFVRRPKDIAHLPLIKKTILLAKKAR